MKNLFLVLLLIFASAYANTVKIEQGVLKGIVLSTRETGRKFWAFLGIPFAKPPVGELRFQPPVQAGPWEGVLDATQDHSKCIQRDIFVNPVVTVGLEDCLYLNVYTPHLQTAGKDLLPVMVYIHGGGYLCGSGNYLSHGPEVLLDRDLVFVSLNFRLGPLGFLATGDEEVPGNNGLKDQSLALTWIRNNVIHFGGDPNSVTIFGESAGGSSTQLHMLSPLSKGLFQKGISQSGTVFSPWAFDTTGATERNSKKLARLLNCPTQPSKEMVRCLKNVDASEIIKQDGEFVEWNIDPIVPFKPIIEPNLEGAFLSEHPVDIYKSKKFSDVPWIMGITKDDGAMRTSAIYGKQLVKEFDENFKKAALVSMQYDHTTDEADGFSQKLKNFYFGHRTLDEDSKTNMTNMFTDNMFLHPADTSVQLHLKFATQPVYFYLFAYRGTKSMSEQFGHSKSDYGVCHADDLIYQFPLTEIFPDYTPTESDLLVSKIHTTLWANFAKTGNPTPETDSSFFIKWEPVRTVDIQYYHIENGTSLQMFDDLYKERVQFWRDLKEIPRHGGLKLKDEL